MIILSNPHHLKYFLCEKFKFKSKIVVIDKVLQTKKKSLKLTAATPLGGKE